MSSMLPGSARWDSKRSGPKVEWKRGMPPTETDPIVSPW